MHRVNSGTNYKKHEIEGPTTNANAFETKGIMP